MRDEVTKRDPEEPHFHPSSLIPHPFWNGTAYHYSVGFALPAREGATDEASLVFAQANGERARFEPLGAVNLEALLQTLNRGRRHRSPEYDLDLLDTSERAHEDKLDTFEF